MDYNKENKKLGLRIKELRTERKYSGTALGEKCGLSRSKISAIENGKENITFKILVKIANGLAIELKSLFK